MATLIPADEATKVTTITTPEGLDEWQRLVDGYIEMVTLPDGRVFVVNEEGKLRGLPMNRRATALWYEAVPAARGVDVLVGDVVLCAEGEID
jgi:hypothetical protein